MERVRPLVEAISAGSGGVVLVSGEPGIGKTRFASEVAGELSKAGANVAWGRCQEITARQAFWPWLQALRSLLDQPLVEELLPRPMWARVHQLFPEFEGLAGAEAENWRDQSPIALLDTLRHILTGLAARGPIALVLEDLQWADDSSLRLIEFLAPDLGSHPVELLLTYRDQEARDHETLRDVIGRLSSLPTTQRVPLGRLNLEETQALLALDLDDHDPLDGAIAEAVHRRTAGNPFFIRQIAQMLNQPETDGAALAAVPPAVQDVIEQRLSRLDGGTRHLLEAAAVCGWEFRPAMIREIDTFEADASELVIDAEQRGLIEADPSTRLGYRFVHHLVWEAVYQTISPLRRAELHMRAAQHLERVHSADRAEYLSRVASHLERGGEAVDLRHALDVFVDAGQQALDQQTLVSATRWFEHAVDAAEQLGLSRELIGLRARMGAAMCELRMVNVQRGVDRLETIAEESLETNDAAFIADAVYVFIRFWGPLTGCLNPSLVTPLIERALDAVGTETGAPRSRLMTSYAGLLLYAWERPDHLEEARTIAADSIAIARKSGSRSSLADALGGAYVTHWGPRYTDIRVELEDERIDLLRALDRPTELVSASMHRAFRRFETGILDMSSQERDGMSILGARTGERVFETYLAWHEIGRLALRGDFSRAQELMVQEDQASDAALNELACRRAPLLLSFARHDGSIAEHAERVRSLLEEDFLYVEGTSLDASTAFLSLIEGDLGPAAEAMAQVVDCGFVRLEMDHDRPAALAMLAEVAVGLGDVERGRAIHEQLRDLEGINPGPLKGIFGSTWRHLGLLSVLCEEFERARDEFGRALEFNSEMGPSVWTGLTQADYADLLLSTADPEDTARATELYQAAAVIAEQQGVIALAERCRDALDRVNGRTTRPALPDSLTRREVEVLRLIADGMTNNEIADALVISVRTVERHVTNAYGKIEARGRADATAYVLKAGLSAAR